MYECHLAKMAKRLRVALDAIELPCFEKMDGLREFYAQLTSPGRSGVMSALLDGPTYKKWWALSALYKQIAH